MSVEIKAVRKRIRTVEVATGKIARTSLGNPIDGGGWPANKQGRGKGLRQCSYVNEALKTK